jgi:hypothetical protein
MIIQMTKQTVYYPESHYKATILLRGTRRVVFFRTAILLNGKRTSHTPTKAFFSAACATSIT